MIAEEDGWRSGVGYLEQRAESGVGEGAFRPPPQKKKKSYLWFTPPPQKKRNNKGRFLFFYLARLPDF